jgi:hypothetical protein
MQFCPASIDIFGLSSSVLLSALLSNALNLFSLSVTDEHARPHKTSDRTANTGILCELKENWKRFPANLPKNCQVEHDR